MPSGLIAKPAPGSGGESSVASILVPGIGLIAPLLFVAGVLLAAAEVPLAGGGVLLGGAGVPLVEGGAPLFCCCLALLMASLAAWIGLTIWAWRVHTDRTATIMARTKLRKRAWPDFQFMNVMDAVSPYYKRWRRIRKNCAGG